MNRGKTFFMSIALVGVAWGQVLQPAATPPTVLNVKTPGLGLILPFGGGYPYTDTSAYTLNENRVFQFSLAHAATVSKVVAYIATPAASSNIRAGLYSANPSTGACSTLLGQTGNASAANAGVVTMTFAAPVVLSAGVYWVAFTVDTAAVVVNVNFDYTHVILNAEGGSPRAGDATASTGTAGTLSLPSTCGAVTGSPYLRPTVALLP